MVLILNYTGKNLIIRNVIVRNIYRKILSTSLIFLISIDRPPAGNISEIDNFISQNILNRFPSTSHVLFGGDFNIDLLDSSNRELEIISNLFMSAFTPIINNITRESDTTGTCIDHFWCNQLGDVGGIFNKIGCEFFFYKKLHRMRAKDAPINLNMFLNF